MKKIAIRFNKNKFIVINKNLINEDNLEISKFQKVIHRAKIYTIYDYKGDMDPFKTQEKYSVAIYSL